MDSFFIALILIAIGGYFFISRRYTPKYANDNFGRRSGVDRRKSFDASRNRGRRSDEDRRIGPDRRNEYRFA